jgi:hypothetical protein
MNAGGFKAAKSKDIDSFQNLQKDATLQPYFSLLISSTMIVNL